MAMLPKFQSGRDLTYSPEYEEKFTAKRSTLPYAQKGLPVGASTLFKNPGREQVEQLNVQNLGIQSRSLGGGDFFKEGDQSPSTPVASPAATGGVQVQPSTSPVQAEQQPSAIPGVQVQGDAPMLPDQAPAGYVTDAQMKSSGRFQDAQNVHQSRLADIERMQQENAARQGTGAQTFTMGQAPQLPGPKQETNSERPGSAKWFYRQAEIRQQSKDTNVNRGLDMEQQRIDQTGNLAQQKLQQDQGIAAGKAGQQQFENQLATDKFGFEQKKAGQEQTNKSLQFDAKLENQLGTIISDPKFRQMSKAIEGASTPEQRAQLMANFQKITGMPYDTVNNYLQKKTNPNSTGLPAALLQQ